MAKKNEPIDDDSHGNKDETSGAFASASAEHDPHSDSRVRRAGPRRISPRKHPGEWAVEQVKLGAMLRQRAQRELGSGRVQTLRQAIGAFEAAIGVYCMCETAAANLQPDRGLSADSGAVDLILEVTCRPFMTDSDELQDAIRLLQASCSREARQANFTEWALSMINLGCALTLAGKCEGAAGDVSRIEEAVDTFHALLSEPKLHGMTYERAIAHINLADALCSMGEVEVADRRVEYLERAVWSLAKGLSLVAPVELRGLVEGDWVGLA